jgi:hypothetical protein
VAGAGRIIIDPGGNTEATFEWGLGKSSSNQAETYPFLQGLHIIVDH